MFISQSPLDLKVISVYPIITFIAIFIIHRFFHIVFQYYSKTYRTLDIAKKQNIQNYLTEVLITSFLMVLMLWSLPYVYNQQAWTIVQTNLFCFAVHLFFSLYLFEIAYKSSMDFPLYIHHIVSIVFPLVVLIIVYHTHESIHLEIGFPITFTALTEQPTFVGLIFYRFKHPYASWVLKFASIQTILFKLGLSIMSFYFLVVSKVWWWWVIWLILIVGLLIPTQFYGAWVLWQLARRKETQSTESRESSSPVSLDDKCLCKRITPINTLDSQP